MNCKRTVRPYDNQTTSEQEVAFVQLESEMRCLNNVASNNCQSSCHNAQSDIINNVLSGMSKKNIFQNIIFEACVELNRPQIGNYSYVELISTRTETPHNLLTLILSSQPVTSRQSKLVERILNGRNSTGCLRHADAKLFLIRCLFGP